MQFDPVDQGARFCLAPGAAITLGRQPQFQLTSAKVSRQHVQLTSSADGRSVTAVALKRIEIRRGQGGPVIAVPTGQQCQLLPGDTVFLERDGDALKSGFILSAAPAASPAVAAGIGPKRASTTSLPAAKRVKPSPAAVAASAQHEPVADQHEEQAPPADMFSPAKQQQQQVQQVLAGVQLAVWDQHHTHKAVALAVQAGAKVKPYVDSSTTHIISCYSMSIQDADKHLQDSKQHQQSAAKAAAAPGFSGSQQASGQGSLHVSRQLQFNASQQAASLQQSDSQQQLQLQLLDQQLQLQDQDAEFEHVDELMSRGVQFVTVKWLTDSLAAGKMLTETGYHIQLHQYQYRLQGSGSIPLQLRQESPPVPAATSKPPSDGLGPELQLRLSDDSQAGAGQQQLMLQQQAANVQDNKQLVQRPSNSKQQNIPPTPDQICRPGEEWGTGGRWIEPWDEAAALGTIDQLLSHWHRTQSTRRQQASAKAAAASAAAAAATEGTPDAEDELGSSDGLSSDEGHSSDGSAIAVQRNKRRLQRYRSAAAAAAAAASPVNSVCKHTTCSSQVFCFVAEMERLKGTYSRGREDQFRIKAVNRAIHELEKTEKPLVTAEDVVALGVGDKTTDKLLEILQTGKLRRNEEVAGSERHQVMALFMGVWGVAESTAEKWYQAGCKTIQDVRHKIDHLTAQQRVGLKYYDDFEQRIPRDEVTESENIVYAVVADALQDLTGKSAPDVRQLMHARVTGSYLRGRRTCGDIDFIIAPGPATANLVGLGALMQGILERLQAQGCITQDMLPLEPRKAMRGPHDELTWMGVWKGPSSPCHRRIDIKLYPRDALAFAVNYFASGQDMCRALRYWCNNPVPRVAAAAAALNPAGNAFRLSDRDLVVIRREYQGMARKKAGGAAAAAAKQEDDADEQHATQGPDTGLETLMPTNLGYSRMGNGGRGAMRETIVGPSIKCTSETDIFRAIGLFYVPPHMRDIV